MAASQTPTENGIKQYMECSICHRGFNTSDRKPKVLPCCHTFCLACLHWIEDVYNRIIVCPRDRREMKLIGRDVDRYPDNHLILAVMANICGDCQELSKIIKLCVPAHCSKKLCCDCKKNHLKEFHPTLRSSLKELEVKADQLQVLYNAVDDTDLVEMRNQSEIAREEVASLCDHLKQKMFEKITNQAEQETKTFYDMQDKANTIATGTKAFVKKTLSQIEPTFKESMSESVLIDAKNKFEHELKIIYDQNVQCKFTKYAIIKAKTRELE